MKGFPEYPTYKILDHTDCSGCPKEDTRSCVFFEHSPVGKQNENTTKVMFVGEAPGATEMRQCKPFVGRSGSLFRKAFVALVKDFPDTSFKLLITNTVKCRCVGPPDIEIVNRCAGALAKEADIFAPHLIIGLGKTSFHALSGRGFEHYLGENRGKIFEYRGYPVRVTYHPAAALRHTNYRVLMMRDLQKYLREVKGLPVATEDKMRRR